MDGIFNDDTELIGRTKKSVTFDKSTDEVSTGLDEYDEENATTLSLDEVNIKHV